MSQNVDCRALEPQEAELAWRSAAQVRPEDYKARHAIERCIKRPEQWRGLATRYEKTATVHRAGLLIAGIFLWSVR